MTSPDMASAEVGQFKLPHPKGRRTYGAFHTPEEALEDGYNLVRLLNGIPIGFKMAVYERFGAYVLVSYPEGR